MDVGIDWVAIAGIVGTLFGVIVGAIATYKVQERQINHIDETRFQEQRLNTYKIYTSSLTKSAISWSLGVSDNNSISEVMESLELIRLVATSEVNEAAMKAHAVFSEIYRLENKEHISKNLYNRFNASVKSFVTQARKELKIV